MNDDDQLIEYLGEDLDVILGPELSEAEFLRHQKKVKKEHKSGKNRFKARVKIVADVCLPIVEIIMKEFQDHIMVRWPCEHTSMYMERKPRGDFRDGSALSHIHYTKSLYTITRAMITLCKLNRAFRATTKEAYYNIIKLIADQNRMVHELHLETEYGLRHPMRFLRMHLLTNGTFTGKTNTNNNDVELTYAPNVSIEKESGFTRRNVLYDRSKERMQTECERFRTVISYLFIAFDKYCKICKKITNARPLFGNMDGWRICRTCKRNKFLEISTVAIRYGIRNILDMKAYKNGTIKLCMVRDANLTNILYIDPSATMLKPTRRMFWVYIDSLTTALGGESQAIERCIITKNLRESVVRIIATYRARNARRLYLDVFADASANGRYKGAKCR